MRYRTVVGTIAVVVGLVVIGSGVARAREMVPGSSPKAKPMRDAYDALKAALLAADAEKAKSAYVGTGADAALLEAYQKGVAAAKQMRAAVDAKFGVDAKRKLPGLDSALETTGVFDFNSVIINGDVASASADSPLGVGLEFRRVGGAWKVRSLAADTTEAEAHVATLKTYTASVAALTDGVKRGDVKSAEAAAKAASDAAAKLSPMGALPASNPAP